MRDSNFPRFDADGVSFNAPTPACQNAIVAIERCLPRLLQCVVIGGRGVFILSSAYLS